MCQSVEQAAQGHGEWGPASYTTPAGRVSHGKGDTRTVQRSGAAQGPPCTAAE